MTDVESVSRGAVACPTFSGDPPQGGASAYDPCLTFERWHSRFLTYLELKGIVNPGEDATPEQVASYEGKRAGHLKTLLRGGASNLIYSLPPADQSSYSGIMQALRNAYSMRPLVAWKAFTSRRFREGEPVDALLASLRAYAGLADATLSAAATESILKLQFLAALPEDSLMFNQTMALDFGSTSLATFIQTAKNFAKPPLTPRDPLVADPALAAAGVYRSGSKGSKGFGKGNYGKGKGRFWSTSRGQAVSTRAQGSTQAPRPNGSARNVAKTCWGCNQPGHLLRDCPTRSVAGGVVVGAAESAQPQN